jgi:hypothetical protein
MTFVTNVHSSNPKYLYLLSDPVNCMFPPITLSNDVNYLTNTNLPTYLTVANDFTNYSGLFYPRRIGFLPKRIAM